MNRRWLWLILTVVFSTNADVIYLKNGDRITGSITQVWDDSITITPSYSGSVTIGVSDVARVKSDGSFKVELDSGEKGEFSLGETNNEDEVKLIAEDRERVIALTDLKRLSTIPSYFDWSSQANLSHTLSRGNTDSQSLNLNADLALRWGAHRYRFEVNSNREENDGTTVKEQDRFDASYNWVFRDPWFLAVNFTAEQDEVAQVEHRYSLSPGVGYNIFDDADRLLSVQLGAGVTDEEVGGVDETTSFVDWRLRYSQEFMGGGLEAFHNHQLSQNLDGRENLVFVSQTGVRYDLIADMFVNAQVNYDWDSEPAAFAEKDDLTFLLGVGIEF